MDGTCKNVVIAHINTQFLAIKQHSTIIISKQFHTKRWMIIDENHIKKEDNLSFKLPCVSVQLFQWQKVVVINIGTKNCQEYDKDSLSNQNLLIGRYEKWVHL